MMKQENKLIFYLMLVQGIYFVLTGAWPVIHPGSFMLVTCPKTDVWLVKTLGAVFFCEGIGFLLSAFMRTYNLPLIFIAFLNALTLALLDMHYVLTGVICKIYLADAFIESVFAAGWIYTIVYQGYRAKNEQA